MTNPITHTFGDNITYRLRSTGNGVKVTRYDGTGLAEGYASKSNLRYFYGEDAETKAAEYAHKKAEQRDAETVVVELGEKM